MLEASQLRLYILRILHFEFMLELCVHIFLLPLFHVIADLLSGSSGLAIASPIAMAEDK